MPFMPDIDPDGRLCGEGTEADRLLGIQKTEMGGFAGESAHCVVARLPILTPRWIG
jgi:hypothetical protein